MSSVRALLRILLCMALALQGTAWAGHAAPPARQTMAHAAHHAGCHDMASRSPAKPMPAPDAGHAADQLCRAFCAWHCAVPIMPGVEFQLIATTMPMPAARVDPARPPPHLPDPIRPPIA